ncbi:MAG: hypothetical protein GYB68_06260 [Chloroflexi bacterium]|nr:hypothetical protein [Chloroflexota bacterium]
MLITPLTVQGRVIGVAQVLDVNPERQFTSRGMGLANALGNQAAVAIENGTLVNDLQQSLRQHKSMEGHLVYAARLSAMGEMAAVVAHQINNPLTTILGDAQMLVQDIPEEDPSHVSAQAILRAGKRAQQVVSRILNMYRRDDEIQEIDVNQSIQEAIMLVKNQLRAKSIDLELDLAPKLPSVSGIKGQLEDVWINILINAYDAITMGNQRDGTIRLDSRLIDDDTMIEVNISDNGPGVDVALLTHVFDPFFTTKPPGKGTGLGLYICRQIIDNHNGDMSIQSIPGAATTVTVHLPIARPPGNEEKSAWRIS